MTIVNTSTNYNSSAASLNSGDYNALYCSANNISVTLRGQDFGNATVIEVFDLTGGASVLTPITIHFDTNDTYNGSSGQTVSIILGRGHARFLLDANLNWYQG
jgi:hypothetical protein